MKKKRLINLYYVISILLLIIVVPRCIKSIELTEKKHGKHNFYRQGLNT